ncbi:MAG: PepSY-like domain-containing protein [Porphyromonas sp.]|nr:PepSY-like domain-containing protein [Porphyromonas sp.]
MKKGITRIGAVIFTMTLGTTLVLSSCSKNNDVQPEIVVGQESTERLPESASQFVAAYFNGYTVDEVVKRDHENESGALYAGVLKKKNNAIITDNVKIEFDRNGQWIEIESLIDGRPIPRNLLSLLPASIVAYVDANYPNIGLQEIERKAYGFKVELVNDKELLFDKNGDLLNDNSSGTNPDHGQGDAGNTIEKFVETHFPTYKIVYIKTERKNGALQKKVYLKEGYFKSYKVVFDEQNNWIEVEGDDDYYLPVPESVMRLVPAGISEYVKRNYPRTFVVELKKRAFGFEVELANDVEIRFDKNGSRIGAGNNPGNNNPDNGNDTPIADNGLPHAANDFLRAHFPNVRIREIEKKRPSNNPYAKVYEVELVNGVEVDFNNSGEWVSVDGDERALPKSFVDTLPDGIRDYIKSRFARAYISAVDKRQNGYKVEIIHRGDDLDLYFDNNGRFIRIDD